MYSRYAERKNWRVEILSMSEAAAGGLKEAIVMISTQSSGKVYSELKYESGVHRVQRVPETEAQGRIHTSAATVAVLPEAEDVDVKIEEKTSASKSCDRAVQVVSRSTPLTLPSRSCTSRAASSFAVSRKNRSTKPCDGDAHPQDQTARH